MVIVVFLFTEELIKVTQFKKIKYLAKDEIVIELKDYDLKITGECLTISYFYVEELFINGKLKGLELLWK